MAWMTTAWRWRWRSPAFPNIRGFGHVKEAHFEQAKAREAALLAQWRNPKALHIVQVA